MRTTLRSLSLYTRAGDPERKAHITLAVEGKGDVTLSFQAEVPPELLAALTEFAQKAVTEYQPQLDGTMPAGTRAN